MHTTSNLSPPARLDIWKNARDWLGDGRSITLATVIDTWGSSPVPLGGQMVIADDETFLGSVSGGCVETDVIVAAREVNESGELQRLRFGVTDETAWASGLPCGGNIQVLLEPLSGSAALELADAILAARRMRQALLVTTDLATGTRTLHATIDGLDNDLAARYRSGRSGIVRIGEAEVFAHALLPGARIIIVGATHIAQALVTISNVAELAPLVVDPRESFASVVRFGDTPVLHAWPKDAFAEIGLDPFTALVSLAHVEHIDDEALSCALRSPARYVGALGSTRNHQRRKARLAAAGFSNEEIARIRCPIGLDIGAVTPQEIALAIAAEVVAAFRGSKRTATVP